MKPLNTLPIEMFLDKARIAANSNQKTITLDQKDYKALADSISSAMARLSGLLDQELSKKNSETPVTSLNMDGGCF